MKLFEKIFGTHSEREIKLVTPIVQKIESYRDAMMALSDERLKGKTDEFKKRLAGGETLKKKGCTPSLAFSLIGLAFYAVFVL